ncbi:MAG: acyloxyacyl hydrolase [Flavobacteriales bacterium]
MRLLYLGIVFMLCAGTAHANPADTVAPRNPWRASLSLHGGFIIPHSNIIQPLVTSHAAAASVFLHRRLNGEKAWHHAYAFPEHGVDVTAIYTGNPKQLGNQVAVSYMLQMPITHKVRGDGAGPFYLGRYATKRHTFFSTGIGLGYSNRPWKLETNHQAAVLGSSFNVALSLQCMHRREIRSWGSVGLGIRITHLSNGAFQLPNLGTNTASLFLQITPGVDRREVYPSDRKVTDTISELPIFGLQHRSTWSFALATGWKEIPPPGGAKYQAVTCQLMHEHRRRVKSSWGYGVDLLYNRSLLAVMNRNADTSYALIRPLQVGAIIGFNIHFHRFELKMQQGVYLWDRWRGDGMLYHRFGLRYRFHDRWFAQLTLKTHFAKADFGELGVGYCVHSTTRRKP